MAFFISWAELKAVIRSLDMHADAEVMVRVAEQQVTIEALEQLIQQLQIAMAVLEQRQSGERECLQAEVEQLQAEMERISEQSTFSGIQILDGSLQNATFQIGSEANSSVVVSISNIPTTFIGTEEAAQAPIELGALPGPILTTFHSTAVRRPPIEGTLAIAAPSSVQAQPKQSAAQSKP